MRDQEKTPGVLLRQLRETLGYNLKDWATIFDTKTAVIEAIESGNEVPDDFLVALLQWFLEGLEHPQNPTQVLPEGWEDDLPNAISVLLNSITHKNEILEDLQDAYNLQQKIIDYNNTRAKDYQQQILNYLEMISQQNDKIKALEAVKETDKKTTSFKIINKVALTTFCVMIVAILFYHSNGLNLFYQQPTVQQIKPMVWKNDILTVKLPLIVTEKEKTPAVIYNPPQKMVTTVAQKDEPKQAKVLGKKVDSITTSKPTGLNQNLANLLANNTERNNYLVEKYSSPKGKTILRFNNTSQQPMIIVLRNYLQQVVYRDTIKTKHHLLDTEKFTPGKYNYWVYFDRDKNYTHTGQVVIDTKK